MINGLLHDFVVLAEYLQKIDPKSDDAKRDWVAIYDECANVLYQVLAMEYVPEIKINWIQALDQLGVDQKRLGRYAVESYLEQILSHGFFHVDHHPRNIVVDNFNGGRLIFYDSGMMESISQNIKEGLLEVFYGVYEKDPEKVLQAMI
ncbi:ABC2-like protein 13 [Perilla frutescens var. frutescens]|nr:ABC2-like protein 13 [Perilla frutescens var. frutescens]